ncbi:MAG: IclR family transcriptional regulator [Burkholderiaceae bacterium]|nr:IclR family transcriptional regulator [Sulfuritalea sp.]MCF8176427.1 IclR family transcriptional regulator [Burkholderiaceae bacterium]MCF8184008.1 IclR family transcriptional regulator [Polynucleobacter sp.]
MLGEEKDEHSRQGIQSIEVGVPLLRVLADHGAPMMLRDLAKAAGMPAAKAHRYLVSFMRTELVTQDPVSGRYDLGYFALDLGLASLARLDAVRVATPALDALGEEIGETVALAVWGNMGPTIVRWVESRRPVTVNLRTGAVMPLLHSAIGLCFVSFFDSPLLQRKVEEELQINARGEDTRAPITRSQLDALTAEAREHGMSRAIGSVIPGINAFSAPVFNHDGQMAAAITGLGPAGLLPPNWNGPAPKAIRAAAQNISRQLGWRATAARQKK